jgi:hypothetical protein
MRFLYEVSCNAVVYSIMRISYFLIPSLLLLIKLQFVDFIQSKILIMFLRRCNDYVKARKHLSVNQAPNILTITLKRFQVRTVICYRTISISLFYNFS